MVNNYWWVQVSLALTNFNFLLSQVCSAVATINYQRPGKISIKNGWNFIFDYSLIYNNKMSMKIYSFCQIETKQNLHYIFVERKLGSVRDSAVSEFYMKITFRYPLLSRSYSSVFVLLQFISKSSHAVMVHLKQQQEEFWFEINTNGLASQLKPEKNLYIPISHTKTSKITNRTL